MGSTTVADTFTPSSLGSVSGTVNFNAPESFVNVTLASGGTVGGSGNVSISGVLTWASGTMTGTGTTTVSGSLNLTGGSQHQVFRGLILNGTGTWTGGNIDLSGGSFTTNGALTVNSSANLNVLGTSGSNSFTVGSSGTLTKKGTGQLILDSHSPLTNSGTIDLQAGTITAANLTNLSGTTLTGGTFLITSSLRIAGANIVTNASTLVLDGPSSSIVNDTTSANALANLGANAATGSLTVQGGRSLNVAGALSNAGSVKIATASSIVTASGNYMQSGGTTIVDGTLDPAGIVDIQGGTLKGIGTILGDLANGGSIQPGDSPGTLSVQGNFSQSGGGTMAVELGGKLSGQHDLLSVSGSATLGGSLTVAVVNGYLPVAADAIPILTAASVSGTFNYTVTNGFRTRYLAAEVDLVENSPPIPNAGGPYGIAEGESLHLDGSASTDVDIPLGDSLTYSWEINGHTGATTGVSPTLTWNQLQALGITDNGLFSGAIKIHVTDDQNLETTATVDLNVTNTPPTATIGNNGPVNEASPATVSFTNPFDPSNADTDGWISLHVTPQVRRRWPRRMPARRMERASSLRLTMVQATMWSLVASLIRMAASPSTTRPSM